MSLFGLILFSNPLYLFSLSPSIATLSTYFLFLNYMYLLISLHLPSVFFMLFHFLIIIHIYYYRALKIKGRDITPYILKRVNELTHGKSLQSNIALVENNAKIGADIAVR